MSEEMRVQKFLSKAGVCSRRKGEEHMQAGRVRVNGEVCDKLGSRVDPATDRVEFDGEVVTLPDTHVYILLNKPTDFITSLDDPRGRKTVVDLLPDDLPRLWPVGRLDYDSQGLLMMTDDGKLTNLITHPSHQLPKTYAVEVQGSIERDSDKLQRLRDGVELDDGYVTAPAEASVTGGGRTQTWLEIVLHEGKNRQIRRMCKAIGHQVTTLRRIAIGTVHIKGLGPGDHRSMTHAEVADLYDFVGAEMPPRAIPSEEQLRRERQAIERGELPDHEHRKKRLFNG